MGLKGKKEKSQATARSGSMPGLRQTVLKGGSQLSEFWADSLLLARKGNLASTTSTGSSRESGRGDENYVEEPQTFARKGSSDA